MLRILTRTLAAILLIASTNTFAISAKSSVVPILNIVPSSTTPIYLSPAEPSPSIVYTVTNNTTQIAHAITVNVNDGLNTRLVTTSVSANNCSSQNISPNGTCHFTVTLTATGASGTTVLAPQVCKSNGVLCSIPIASNRIPITTQPTNVPAITSVLPSSGSSAGGTPVTIGGTDLQAATSVIFGGVAATITSNTSTAVSVTTGASTTMGPVTVVVNTARGAATKVNGYTYNPVVTASAGSNGSISPSGAVVVAYNQNQLFTASPNTGYAVKSWTLDGSPVCGVASTCTLSNVVANHTLIVNYKTQKFTVTPSVASGSGTISPSTVQTVSYGGSQKFTATPSGGSVVSGWTLNGSPDTACGTQTTCTVSDVTQNETIAVSFSSETFTVTPSAGANGSISPSTPQPVSDGGSITFTASPDSGYAVSGWTVNGSAYTACSTNTTCQLTNVTQNTTISVAFSSSAITATLLSGCTSTGTTYPGVQAITCTVTFTNHTSTTVPASDITYSAQVTSGSGSITPAANGCQLNANGGTCNESYTFTPAPSTTVYDPTLAMSISTTSIGGATLNHTTDFTEPLTVQTALTCNPSTVVASATSSCSLALSNAGASSSSVAYSSPFYNPTITPTASQGSISNVVYPSPLASGSNAVTFTYTAPSDVSDDTSDQVSVNYADNWGNSVTITPFDITLIPPVTLGGIRCYPEPATPGQLLTCNALMTNVTSSASAIPAMTGTIGSQTGLTTTNNCSGSLASNTPCTISFSATLPSTAVTSVAASLVPSDGGFTEQTATIPVYPTSTPNIQANPLVCDSTQMAYGASSTPCSVLFRNLGTTTATGVSLTPSVTGGGTVSTGTTTCSGGGTSMSNNQTCQVDFTYTPAASGSGQTFATISVNYTDSQSDYPAFSYPFTIAVSAANTNVQASVIPGTSGSLPPTSILYSGTLSATFYFQNFTGSALTFNSPQVYGVVNGQVQDLSYAIDSSTTSCLSSLPSDSGSACQVVVNFSPYQFNGFKIGDEVTLYAWLPLTSPSGVSEAATTSFAIGSPTIFNQVIVSQLAVNPSSSFSGAFLFGNAAADPLSNLRSFRQFLPAGYSPDPTNSCASLLTNYTSTGGSTTEPCSSLTSLAVNQYCYACFKADSGLSPTGTNALFQGQLASDESVITADRVVPVTETYRNIKLDNQCPSTVWPSFISGAAYYFCNSDADCPLGTSCYTAGHQCQVLPISGSSAPCGAGTYQVPTGFGSPAVNGQCSNGCTTAAGVPAVCPYGSTCDQSNGLCFWTLPTATTSFDTAALATNTSVIMQIPNVPLTKAGDYSTVWSGALVARTGCTLADGVFSCQTANCPVKEPGVKNYCTTGPAAPFTQAEFTFLYDNNDYYDVEIINGSNIPMSIEPDDPAPVLDPTSPYTCNTPGKAITTGDASSACTWDYAMNTYALASSATPTPYSAIAMAMHTLVTNGGLPCPTGTGCATGICGLSQQYAVNSGSISSLTLTCGSVIGMWTSNELCANNNGLNYVDTSNPLNSLDCQATLGTATLSEWFGCNGGGATKSCYSTGAESGSCCGCPYWTAGISSSPEYSSTPYTNLHTVFATSYVLYPQANNDYCQSNSSYWSTDVYQPSLIWMKQACGSLYTFPYDDASSTFTCSSASLVDGHVQNPAGKVNTQYYKITFCPGGNTGQVNSHAIVLPS